MLNRRKKELTFALLGLLIASFSNSALAQYRETGQNANYISTGMPILLIAPDAVSGALGDAGVASTPDAYSGHWNNAKFAFTPNKIGISTTYTPWLQKLAEGMSFIYLGGYYRINDRSTAAASITYFSLGEIMHTGESGDDQGIFKPNEFAIDGSYAMKLADNLSLGATARFCRSDLTNGMVVEHQTTKAANSLAADVGLYYENNIDRNQSFAVGGFISNLGAKLSYSDDDTDNEFLPANLRFGGRYSYEIDEYNKLNVLLDFNKLLVPTPPVQNGDTLYSSFYPSMTAYNQTSAMLGAIQSFYDAPGGIREELQEISISFGAEYWYAETFAARCGYFWEHNNKGGRQYITTGIGVRYQKFVFDFSYLIPTTKFNDSPLANTIRISLTMNLQKEK